MNSPDYIIWLENLLKFRTQTDLADELNVTHATLNRWVHQKTTPHPRAVASIKLLYEQYSFYSNLDNVVDVSQWQKKFSGLRQKEYFEILLGRKDLYEDSIVKLTYHTNKIEGSTLSLRETQNILFDNLVVAKHSLVEHLEVSNHQLAFRKILESVQNDMPIDVHFILRLHQILMSGILTDAGQFRLHPVRIVGARVVPPNYMKVPEKMTELCAQMQATKDPLGIIMQHAAFEAIHPFSDGNGRLGRLLMNYQLLRLGYPLLIIRSERKNIYYDSLEKAQVSQDYEPLFQFSLEELEESAKLCL